MTVQVLWSLEVWNTVKVFGSKIVVWSVQIVVSSDYILWFCDYNILWLKSGVMIILRCLSPT